jgi:hypothetical protein
VDGPLAASRCETGVSGEITVRAAKLTRAPHISTARIVRTGWFYPYRKSRPITGAHGFSTTGRLLAKGSSGPNAAALQPATCTLAPARSLNAPRHCFEMRSCCCEEGNFTGPVRIWANLALLTCRVFTQNEVVGRQTWHFHFTNAGVRAKREFPAATIEFDRSVFARDRRIAGMKWDR